MLKLLKENPLLLIILVGGVLFLIVAVSIVGVLLAQSSQAEPIADVADDPPAENPVVVEVEIDAEPPAPTPTPTPAPTDTPEPTATTKATAAAVAGDKLSLPTATPSPSPLPTSTDTPTPAPAPESVEGLRIGNIAPDFTLGSNRASRVSLSELRGKIVILNFWASWCPPCRYEVPDLQAIHNELGPQGVVVLAINEGEKLETVARFAQANGISFNVWLDEDRWAGNIYQVRSIPTTYFIDEEGIIRDIQIGTMRRDQIVSKLEKLL